MHGTCSSGTMNVAIWLLFLALTSAAFPAWTMFQRYLSLWILPFAANMKHLPELFSAKRVTSYKEARKFKCQASEVLAVYPILAQFVQTSPMKRGFCIPQCEAFLSMCLVLDTLQDVALGAIVPHVLRAHVDACLQAFLVAGWGQSMTKKLHWMLHFGDHLERFNMLPACWSMERKHKLANRFANPQNNTTNFERSILQEMLSHNLAAVAEPGLFDTSLSLLSPRPASQKLKAFMATLFDVQEMQDIISSKDARVWPGFKCGKGDVVLVREHASTAAPRFSAAEIWLHVEFQSAARKTITLTLVSMWAPKAYEPGGLSANWLRQTCPMFIETNDILACVTYSKTELEATTLIPASFR